MAKENKNYYISVAGVLDSGKTTICNLLSQKLGLHLFEENVNENVFIPLFYKDARRWAFATQFFYLYEKAVQLEKLNHSGLPA